MKMITERLKFADVFPDKAATVAQRLHIKKDEIPFVRKYYTAEKDKSEVKKKERAVISYISTGIKDRDGEKLVPEGVILENYQKNPIVPFAHCYKSIPPAKNMWIKRDEKGLVAKTVFAKNQRAEEYYQAYTEDVGGTGPLLNAFSVGFIPLEWEDTDTKALEKNPDLPKRIYNKWELLEYSLVPIPSCAEALTIAVEKGLFSKKFMKQFEIEVVKDVPDREVEVEIGSKNVDNLDEGGYSGSKEIVDRIIEKEVEVEIEVEKIKGVKASWEDESDDKLINALTKGHPDYKGGEIADEVNKETLKAIAEEARKKEEAFIHGDPEAKDNIVGVLEMDEGKDVGYLVDAEGKTKVEIEEATKDVRELLVIDEENLRSKINAFAAKYRLNPGYHYAGDVGDVIKDFELKYNLKTTFDKDGEYVITKPETTENFHHIPVNPGCKITATITISAAKGIKATYCGEVKKVHTYLFDVEKWTMDEAKAWVKANKGLETTILALALCDAYDEFMGFSKDKIKEEELEIKIKAMADLTPKKIKEMTEAIKANLPKEEKIEEKTEEQVEVEKKEVPEETDSLRDPVVDEPDEVKGGDREKCEHNWIESSTKDAIFGKKYFCTQCPAEKFVSDEQHEFKRAVDQLNEKLIQEKDDHIADLKAGRVLSRKNRNIVKDAITALNAVLKADATGTQEDEEIEDKDDVTERTVELEKDGDTKTFDKKDIEFLVEKLVDKKATTIIEKSFEKQGDPEVIQRRVKEAVRLEIDKRKGMVR